MSQNLGISRHLRGLALFVLGLGLAAGSAAAGQLSGRILDAHSGAPIADARALVYTGDLETSPYAAYSGADGAFTLEGLPPATYYLLIDGPGMRDLLVGGDQACTVREDDYRTYAACDPTRGTPFAVGATGETAAGLILLNQEGRVRGTMRLAPGRVEWQQLQIFNSGGRRLIAFTPPGALNEWAFDLPVPGESTYFLTGSAAEHLTQLYDHVDCALPGETECTDFSAGEPVTVLPGRIRDGIEFDLHLDQRPCFGSPTTICLNGDRFSVRGWHADSNGNVGADNSAARITEESGFFTFFDPDNVELVVKVLDACDDFGAFWVFAAGLTDVNNILLVRDHWEAKTARYDARGNRPYRPFIDSTTFVACDLQPPAPETVAAGSRPAASSPPAPAPLPGQPNGCGGDAATRLCLGGRFAVEAEWTTAFGESGDALPRPLTADTGFFYFFSPDNIEVVVKVLDACRADLGNRYWVFAAGMTDVAVTLKVTDTATGEEKVYLSPLGGLFQPIFDLEGFDVCP